MRVVDWLQPRDPQAATRMLALMVLVAAAVSTVVGVAELVDSSGEPWWPLVDLAIVIVLAGIGWLVLALARRPLTADRRVMWVLIPAACTLLILIADLLTWDAGITGIVFLTFPALYAAAQLRAPGVILVMTMLATAELIILFTILPFWEAVVTAAYLNAVGLTAVWVLYKTVERREQLVSNLEQLAAVDPLTGLVTRRVLDEAARTALSRSVEEGTGLILLDVDHFKQINDTYGHPAGDHVLVELAEVLRRSCRPTDVVSRLGGDEVAVLLPGLTLEHLTDRARQILDAVGSHPIRLDDGRTIVLSISCGVAHVPSHADDQRSLYTAADIALYEAKRQGRGRFVVHAGQRRSDAAPTDDASDRPIAGPEVDRTPTTGPGPPAGTPLASSGIGRPGRAPGGPR